MLNGFKEWLKKPYDDEMDALSWFYFVGFIITLLVAWKLIMRHVLQED